VEAHRARPSGIDELVTALAPELDAVGGVALGEQAVLEIARLVREIPEAEPRVPVDGLAVVDANPHGRLVLDRAVLLRDRHALYDAADAQRGAAIEHARLSALGIACVILVVVAARDPLDVGLPAEQVVVEVGVDEEV